MDTLVGKIPAVARVLFGGIFALFGLNGFLNFLPLPSPTGAAAQFTGGLAAAGYFYPLLAATQLVAGVLLLSGRFVPLALALLAPVIVNVVGYHLSVEPEGLGPAVVVLALEIYLAWAYRDSFAPMLRARAVPTAAEESGQAVPHHA
ncbi:DoxX family membrane protein [Pendulispora albinea]|uniref:DoxX family protein n=1 Tax=Pendulispora albinea TaxID=2741071 RepID=A0ABZ2LNR9_9BACT